MLLLGWGLAFRASGRLLWRRTRLLKLAKVLLSRLSPWKRELDWLSRKVTEEADLMRAISGGDAIVMCS